MAVGAKQGFDLIALALAVLALVFAVGDLLGERRAMALEKALLRGTRRHRSLLATLSRFAGMSFRLPLVIGRALAAGALMKSL